MSVLTTTDIAQMTTTQETTLDQTCTIQRPSYTNTDGYAVESLSTVGTAIPCRVFVTRMTLPTAEVEEKGGRVIGVEEYMIKVKKTQDLDVHDRIVVSSKTFEVESVLEDHQWIMLKRARLTKIAGD